MAAFAAQALLSFWWDITHRGAVAAMLLERAALPLSDDGAIVTISARLTIALIPMALVWFLASPFARWMVVVMALGRLALNLPETLEAVRAGLPLRPVFAATQLLSLAAAAALFAPGARRWFGRGEANAAVFA
jgi:hypothetical protein